MSTDKPPTLSRSAPPRLRIHHLVACAAVVALQLTLRLMLWRNTAAIDQLPAPFKVLWAIGLCFATVGLMFALLSIYWQRKGYAALVQPGQWLLVSYLVDFAQSLIGCLVWSHLFVTDRGAKSIALWNNQDYYHAAASILYAILSNMYFALPALFFAWCAWRVADTRPWRVLFLLSAFGSLLDDLPLCLILYPASGWFILKLLGPGMFLTGMSMLSVLVWIIVTEYRREQRFWTHWLGVGLCVATSVLEVASGVMNLFGWY